MEEREIRNVLEASKQRRSESNSPESYEFVAIQTTHGDQTRWTIQFNYAHSTHELTLKRQNCDGPRARKFRRFNGVVKWMGKMGITEFSVRLTPDPLDGLFE